MNRDTAYQARRHMPVDGTLSSPSSRTTTVNITISPQSYVSLIDVAPYACPNIRSVSSCCVQPLHRLGELRRIAPEFYPNGSNDNLFRIMMKAFTRPDFYACMDSNVQSVS